MKITKIILLVVFAVLLVLLPACVSSPELTEANAKRQKALNNFIEDHEADQRANAHRDAQEAALDQIKRGTKDTSKPCSH